jgi:hypothetical protein
VRLAVLVFAGAGVGCPRHDKRCASMRLDAMHAVRERAMGCRGAAEPPGDQSSPSPSRQSPVWACQIYCHGNHWQAQPSTDGKMSIHEPALAPFISILALFVRWESIKRLLRRGVGPRIPYISWRPHFLRATVRLVLPPRSLKHHQQRNREYLHATTSLPACLRLLVS